MDREVYPSVAASTSATTLYTNALAITAQTYHDQARQTIQVNEKTLPLRTTQVQEQITTPYDFPKIKENKGHKKSGKKKDKDKCDNRDK